MPTPKKKLTSEIVEVTPAMAREWLMANTSNRSLRRVAVTAYARDIAAGNWEVTGEAVKFSEDGVLLDGQHRLAACVEADKPFTTLVIRNVAGAAQGRMDSGIVRKFADQLSLAGEPSPTVLSAVLRRIALWEAGLFCHSSSLKVTFSELEDKLHEEPQVRESVRFGSRQATAAGLHPSVLSFLHWLLGKAYYGEAQFFLDRVADGAGLPSGHPVLILRERIRRERDLATRRNGVDPDATIALVIYAWNAHRAGERRTKLQLPKGGLTNENFPMPK